MKKQIALLPLLLLMVACSENTKTDSTAKSTDASDAPVSTGSSESSSSSSSSATEEPILPTDNLTEEMMADIKLGYSADYTFQIKYADGSSGSSYHYVTSSGLDGFSYESFYSKNGEEKRTSYVNIETKENDEYAYDASLGLDNTIWYKHITEEDSITNEEYDVEWADAGYSDVFASLSASDFTKEDNNTFVLSNEKTIEFEYSIGKQFFSPYSLYSPNTDPKSFKLKTNGNKIVGFELEYLPYTSYGTISYYTSSGKFTKLGSDAFKKLEPVQGETKPELDAILNKLKGTDGKQNYQITQTQYQFDYQTNQMNSLGELDITVQDGDKAHWIYKNTSGKRTNDYGYYAQKSDDGEDSRRGAIQIGENYYNDIYLYSGSMKDYLPSFDISSIFFDKDNAASVDGKVVYRLNKAFDISLDNNSTLFTPEEIDSYRDRIINLTITEDGDTITIRNSTDSSGKEEDGLILNCEFTNIGKVTGLYSEDHMKETVDDLKWTDLLSRNEAVKDSIVAIYPADVLDSIPTLGGTWSNINVEASTASNPTFGVYTYDQDTNAELMTEMGTKLAAAGFTAYTPESISDSQKSSVFYRKNVDITYKGKTKTCSLNIELNPWWNKQLSYGLFQICLSLSAAV